jgi:hypothetical protein
MPLSEKGYLRILNRVTRLRKGDFGGSYHGCLSSLSEASHTRIWNYVSQDASRLSLEELRDILKPQTDWEEASLRANMAKRKLVAYVREHGPFVFENDRCLLILADQFGWEDWQYMRVPVVDVTNCAQQAFVPMRNLQPEDFLNERIATWLFWILIAGILLSLWFCSAR